MISLQINTSVFHLQCTLYLHFNSWTDHYTVKRETARDKPWLFSMPAQIRIKQTSIKYKLKNVNH